jgi:hypothetical protein
MAVARIFWCPYCTTICLVLVTMHTPRNYFSAPYVRSTESHRLTHVEAGVKLMVRHAQPDCAFYVLQRVSEFVEYREQQRSCRRDVAGTRAENHSLETFLHHTLLSTTLSR